ncbi:M28 family peptidase [Sungkyunkwania multivorans]|uniref:M28 family peptidase n=1 Tax=Sungkyunkwania multivorans TaxID=1173618 RepID=A0ABW3CWW3_9FLAO
MKRSLLGIALVAMMGCGGNKNTVAETGTNSAPREIGDPVQYANTINAQDLSKHLYIYASDEYAGRETGKPGQKKAVEYLKNYYVGLGVPAAKGNNDFIQKVPLEMMSVPNASITSPNKNYKIGEDFATFSASKNGKIDVTSITFVGYGIEDEKYSDYDDVDVDGKIVLIKAGEPKNDDGTYVITGSAETSSWSNIRQSFGNRIEIAKSKGAKGLLYYDAANFPLVLQQFKFVSERAKNGGGQMSLKKDGEDFFYFFVNETMAKDIYADIENTETSQQLQTKLSIDIANTTEEVSSENVVAFIEGVEKPNEYVVISAHLDHIGVSADGQINNGADDDGSGTVSVLEIAEAFKKAAAEGNGPKRSVVFLHVTGEEKGLLGSEYYTDNPIFPLEDTVVNLNIDMVGRTDPKRNGGPDYIYLIGSDKLSSELHSLSEDINTKYANLELDYTYNDENDPNRFYYRSDHYNFAKNNVPIIFYFNGTHDDYHRPSDTPDKIEYELMVKRAKLIFHTAWEIANRDNRIVADKLDESTGN